MQTISRIIVSVVCFIVFCVVVFFSGYYAGSTMSPPQIIKRYEVKWRDRIVIRDYTELSLSDCQQLLSCYDTARPTLDIQPVQDSTFKLSASLCERSWDREVKLSVGNDGRWKYYIGAGVLIGGMVAYGIFKSF